MPKELPRQSGHLDINIEDGVGLSFYAIYKIDGVAVDVTGYTASFKLRNNNGQTGDPILELTDGSGITVGNTDGRFDVKILDTDSTFGETEFQYSLVVTPAGGSPVQLLRGSCFSWSGAG